MKTSHEGLSISESDWQVFVQHTLATLDTFGVQGKEREEFLAAAASLKGDIVEPPRHPGSAAQAPAPERSASSQPAANEGPLSRSRVSQSEMAFERHGCAGHNQPNQALHPTASS